MDLSLKQGKKCLSGQGHKQAPRAPSGERQVETARRTFRPPCTIAVPDRRACVDVATRRQAVDRPRGFCASAGGLPCLMFSDVIAPRLPGGSSGLGRRPWPWMVQLSVACSTRPSRVIEDHPGWISARNAPGGGAVFSFGLPLPQRHARQKVADKNSSADAPQ